MCGGLSPYNFNNNNANVRGVNTTGSTGNNNVNNANSVSGVFSLIENKTIKYNNYISILVTRCAMGRELISCSY